MGDARDILGGPVAQKQSKVEVLLKTGIENLQLLMKFRFLKLSMRYSLIFLHLSTF